MRGLLVGTAPAAGLHGFTCGPVHPIERVSVAWTDRAPASSAELERAPPEVCGHVCQASECRYVPRCADGGADASVEAGPRVGGEIDPAEARGRCSTTPLHEVICVRHVYPAAGRLPMATSAPPTRAGLEAVSVRAFSELARQLHDLGAPRRLVRWAERSSREEIAHTRAALRAEGRARECRALLGRRRRPRRATLLELAVHNAREGCVRELAAALEVAREARDTPRGDSCHALRRIALDEASHADLALAIDRWARARLDRASRAEVDAARDRALAELPAGEARDVAALLRR